MSKTLVNWVKYDRRLLFENECVHNEISRLSGIKQSALLNIKKKGIGAFYSNPSSVRPNVTSAERWGIARVYSAVMGGKASKVDYTELKRGRQK